MIGLTLPLNAEMQAVTDEHRDWLSNFDSRYLANKEKLFKSDNEAAMVIAPVRRRLQGLKITIKQGNTYG